MLCKFLRRTLYFVLILALLLPVFSVLTVSAAPTASASMKLSKVAPYVNETVYVTVTYSSSTPIAAWGITVQYDTSRLKYVSGADSASGNTLKMVDYSQKGGDKTVQYRLAFQTIALGNATVSATVNEMYAEDYSSFSVSNVSRTINVSQRPAASSENRLSSLTVEGVTLTPEFAADTTEYTATVPYSSASLTFNATTRDDGASVAVSGADALAVGENTVTVTVTAENGAKKTYTVTVTREDSVFAGALFTENGEEWHFVRDPSEVQSLPAGFSASEGTYQGSRVLVFKNTRGSATLAVLQNTAEEVLERHYLYDEKTGELFAYLSVETLPQTYIFLNKPQDVEVPEGFRESFVIVAEREVDAWESIPEKEGEESVLLVYATALDGEALFYRYNAQTGDLSPYLIAAPQVSEDGKTMEEMEAERAALQSERDRLYKLWNFTVLLAFALIFLFFILFVIFAILFARRGKKLRKAQASGEKASENPLAADTLCALYGAAQPSSEDVAEETVSEEVAEEAPPAPAEEPSAPFEGMDLQMRAFDTSAYIPELDGAAFTVNENGEEVPVDFSNGNTDEVFFQGVEETPLVSADAPFFEEQSDVAEAPLASEEESVTAFEEEEPMGAQDAPAPFVPIWEELASEKDAETPSLVEDDDDFDILAPSRPKRVVEKPVTEKNPTPVEETGHPDIVRVFKGESEAELFRKNNPPIDEEEEDSEDSPVYGFDDEK